MAIAKRRKLRYDNLCASAALHRGAETKTEDLNGSGSGLPFPQKVHRMFKTVSSDAQLRGRHWGGLCTGISRVHISVPQRKDGHQT